MSTAVYQQRLARCRSIMREWGLDSLILTPGAAMRYLTGFSEEGFERLLCLIVPDHREPCFVVPSLNAEQAKANPAEIEQVYGWDDTQGWNTLLADLSTELGLNTGNVGVDAGMPARFLLPIQELIPPTLTRSAAPVFEQLRAVKDAQELDAMRRAGALTDRAYLSALAACEIGMTEAELTRVVHDTIADAGGTLAFETIIGTGPNTALPHHSPGSRRIEEGDVVLFDLGAQVDGYCGDITRVASFGDAPAKAAEIYDVVYQAHTRAAEAVAPGHPASYIDRVARQVIGDAGYGDFFIHRTGHGIGLEDHEAPNIVHGNDKPLNPGNCFSIEPGIYLPGSFGVRLENIFAVTETGCEAMNAPIPPKLTDVRELRRA